MNTYRISLLDADGRAHAALETDDLYGKAHSFPLLDHEATIVAFELENLETGQKKRDDLLMAKTIRPESTSPIIFKYD